MMYVLNFFQSWSIKLAGLSLMTDINLKSKPSPSRQEKDLARLKICCVTFKLFTLTIQFIDRFPN